jgi:hypothetical protein
MELILDTKKRKTTFEKGENSFIEYYYDSKSKPRLYLGVDVFR